MDIFKNTTIIAYCYFINIHYGIYRKLKKRFIQISNNSRFKKWCDGKKELKFDNKINEKR